MNKEELVKLQRDLDNLQSQYFDFNDKLSEASFFALSFGNQLLRIRLKLYDIIDKLEND